MQKRYVFKLLVLLMFGAFTTYCQQTVAVLDFESDYFAKTITKTVTEKFIQLLLKDGGYVVVERNQIDKVLNELGFQSTGCTDKSCAVQIGKILNAERIFIGSINNIGDIIALHVKEVDVSNGQVLKSYEANCKSCDLDSFYEKYLPCILSKNKVTGSAVRIVSTLSIPVYMDGKYVGNTTSNGEVYILDLPNVILGKHIFALCTLDELSIAKQNLEKEDVLLDFMKKSKGDRMTLLDYSNRIAAYQAHERCDKGRTEVIIGENELVILTYEDFYLYVRVRTDLDRALNGDFTPNKVYPHPTKK